LNPRDLRAKFHLHPGDTVDIIQIPLVASTPFPFSVAVEYWLRDQGSSRQSLVLQDAPLGNDMTFDFQPGELAVNCAADGGFVQSALKWPEADALTVY
jgi:hypothetical protein